MAICKHDWLDVADFMRDRNGTHDLDIGFKVETHEQPTHGTCGYHPDIAAIINDVETEPKIKKPVEFNPVKVARAALLRSMAEKERLKLEVDRLKFESGCFPSWF